MIVRREHLQVSGMTDSEAAQPAAAPPGAEGAARPLPADPRWRVAHLPFLTAFSVALMMCAASVGFFAAGAPGALGAAAGVAIVTVSYTMSTLVLAWADTVRPALLMPLGLVTYVVKYALLGVILAFVVSSEWPGRVALGWGVLAGVVGWTTVQIWWVARRGHKQ
jgi:hypothetical protein